VPSPIAHLVYGQQLLRQRSEISAPAFLRGTIFPDIRYLAQIDRRRTHHPHEATLEVVMAESNAWRAGYLFHNWLDDAWNRFMSQYDLDETNPQHGLTWAALKLLEEPLMRQRLRQITTVVGILSVADPEALEFGLEPVIVKRWGQLVGGTLPAGLTELSRDQFAQDALHLDAQHIGQIRRRVSELEHEGVWGERLEACWRSLSARFP
jgi:hypothetical protein